MAYGEIAYPAKQGISEGANSQVGLKIRDQAAVSWHGRFDADAVVVHERLRLVDAIRHCEDTFPREPLALVHDGINRREHIASSTLSTAAFLRRQLRAWCALAPGRRGSNNPVS